MKKIDQELGIDENFGLSQDEPEELAPEEKEEDLEAFLDAKVGKDTSQENAPIEAELARINRREKVEMGHKIEELRRNLDEKDLKVTKLTADPLFAT